MSTMTFDSVKTPEHYNTHPSGIEPIEITQHLNFCLGNVVKYVMRCDLKGKPIEDLRKARTYLDYEIVRREKVAATIFGGTISAGQLTTGLTTFHTGLNPNDWSVPR